MSFKTTIKKIMAGCLGGCLTLVSVVIMVCLVALIVFFLRYETWESDNREKIDESAVSLVPYNDSKRLELDRRIAEFNTSTVQREVLSLDCDMVNLIFEDIAAEHWQVDD